MTPTTALHLCLLFGGASLMSIGGGNSVVPEIELQAVDTYHWITRSQFADLFALAQAAPGPSILIVTLVGYAAAGVQARSSNHGDGAARWYLVLVFARFGARRHVTLAVRIRTRTGAGRRRPDRGERRHSCACADHSLAQFS